jgi:hypothetical protein
MNTVTITFTTSEPPQLIFTGVTYYKHDPNTGYLFIRHDAGEYSDTPLNVQGIEIK